MQNGSGTFDLLPGITYTGRSKDWSWGGQFNAIVRLGENDDNYTLGNVYSASVWGARCWVDWLSSSARLIGEVVEDIDGADPRLNPLQVPTADPNLRAGNFLSLGLGSTSWFLPARSRVCGYRSRASFPWFRTWTAPKPPCIKNLRRLGLS